MKRRPQNNARENSGQIKGTKQSVMCGHVRGQNNPASREPIRLENTSYPDIVYIIIYDMLYFTILYNILWIFYFANHV